MTRREKVDALMTLAGVPVSDFEVCRRNYEQLDERELEARLARMRAAKRRIEKWQRSWRPLEEPYGEEVSYPGVVDKVIPLETHEEAIELDAEEALVAFARVENAIAHLHPDAIIGLNQEGRTIVKSLLDDLDFSPTIVSADSDNFGHITWNDPVKSGSVVAIVGHYLRTGQTMAEVAAQVKNIFSVDRVVCAVLAASEIGAHAVSRENKLIFHYTISNKDMMHDKFRKRLVPLTDTGKFSKVMPDYLNKKHAKILEIRREIEDRFPEDF